MYPATCELLERLAEPFIQSVRDLLNSKPDLEEGRAILDDVHHLEELLDRARHELKGGARHV